jgi:DNA-directed RNA polymerase subunit H (RpoH/RPB5)
MSMHEKFNTHNELQRQQSELAAKALPGLRARDDVAQKLGEKLGRREIL